MTSSNKPIIFSGAQPSGSMTLGNYIGAVQNWKEMEQDYQCIFSIVDLHSLTVRQDPKQFKKTVLSFLAQYLACGLDPNNSIIFFQSHVKEHSELSWILGCNTYLGELNRMTQFKEKSERHADNVNAGLYTYPILMAADILLYQTDLVPVGEDQKQHLELARDIAERFNGAYGNAFKVPEIHIPKIGARIMSLQEPEKKMSKSDENEKGVLFLLDEENVIRKKIKRAVTDNENQIAYNDSQPGIKNLITIYSKLKPCTVEEVVEEYADQGYGTFKKDVADLVVDRLQPVKDEYNKYMENKDYLEDVYHEGARKAAEIAADTMEKVKDKLGLVN
ncbi:tryptophan--tRNA ligase [Natranaerobius thermophilus]|uniref:Tryptophan--tRNA ligase n=1 Tax=Natranaerobius thermophilus (strain ATCC BAA-1301 / DSM 18059 / JW/NM-WN-LF) TaxID=457570 RepID=B2A6N6_NATTJ|nr:tryptophan--tRNA ligase [Natranaerobius thermophilus]ACB84169.1 tryptophanyl-tRNA synthetase [Natranaerobius thermophilus JW/NM-WN-LF]